MAPPSAAVTTATNTNTCNSSHRSTTNPLTKRPTSRDALRKGHPLSQTDQPKVVPDRAMYCRKIIPFAARQRHRAYKHQRGRWLAVTTRTRNTTTGLDRCTIQSQPCSSTRNQCDSADGAGYTRCGCTRTRAMRSTVSDLQNEDVSTIRTTRTPTSTSRTTPQKFGLESKSNERKPQQTSNSKN